MGQETENIEAKLAAYVDGQLNAAERAEIEKYLADNPEHCTLIADLMKTRDELRGLPKEMAPSDLAETLHGQLERSALLDGPEISRPILRISRMPQLAALAAILLLTVGLGIVLYFVLFPAKPVSFSIAPTKTPATMEAPVVVADRAAAVPAATEKALEITPAGGEAMVVAKSSDQPLASTQPAANDALVLVVATDDPQLTQTQVTDYLKSNGIAAQPVTEPMPEPLKLAQSQVAEGSRLNVAQREVTTQPEGKAAAPSLGAASAQAQVQAQAPVQSPASAENINYSLSAQSPATRQTEIPAQQPIQQKLQQQIENTNGYIVRGVTRRQADSLALTLNNSRKGQLAYFTTDEAKQIASNGVTNQPLENAIEEQSKGQVQLFKAKTVASSYGEKDSATDQEKLPTFAGKVAASAAPATTAPTNGQAGAELRDAITSPAPAATPAAVATTQETAIAKNDTLMISISDLAGPGQESVLRATVAGDGSINLPQVGKVSVAGLTPLQCQQAISEQCKQANLVPNANVSVRKLDEIAAAGASATTRPAAPVMKASATPRDEKLDMLILLKNQQPLNQPNVPNSPQIAPSTAPAGKL